ncbi:uncharacterized protein LOC105185880 [Harpegnathos saltator]|uniref:uncharacterized protein LOC105185880 n=1 Tax=Harpegnathos saltator TaxID=610380 RepID=UPI000DBED64B|nr:uncharacterized protein LOC105185880 [Harpegnathos saltator]
MQKEKYNVSGLKCSTKLQSLKRTFKAMIDHNKKSGNNRKEWEYQKNMEELFSNKPWVQPLSIAGSHIEDDIKEEKENILERCTKKRKLSMLVEEYTGCTIYLKTL